MVFGLVREEMEVCAKFLEILLSNIEPASKQSGRNYSWGCLASMPSPLTKKSVPFSRLRRAWCT